MLLSYKTTKTNFTKQKKSIPEEKITSGMLK